MHTADKFALSPDAEARDKQYNRFCKKFREEIAPCFKRIAIGCVSHGKSRNGEGLIVRDENPENPCPGVTG